MSSTTAIVGAWQQQLQQHRSARCWTSCPVPLTVSSTTSANTASSQSYRSTPITWIRSSTLSSMYVDSDDEEDDRHHLSKEIADVLQQKIQRFVEKRPQRALFKSLLPFRFRSSKNSGGRGGTLDLSNLGLHTLPEKAMRLMQEGRVEKLCLARNEPMVVVPDLLVQGCVQYNHREPLASLQRLDISRCQIIILPEDWDLPNLIHLDLSHNRIRDFPSKSVLKGVPLLRELNLFGNRLVHIPNFGTSVTTATSALTMSSSAQTSVPAATSGSASHSQRQRSSLRASRSSCTSAFSKSNEKVPQFLQELDEGFLTHLTVLNVGSNDLTYLPDRLPISLKTLIACNNFLSQVPEALVCSRNGFLSSSLKELNVSSNPMEDPPLEVCEAGLRAMRKYFEAQEEMLYHCERLPNSVLSTSSRGGSGGAMAIRQHQENHQQQQLPQASAPRCIVYQQRHEVEHHPS